jgi:hypothetical protein
MNNKNQIDFRILLIIGIFILIVGLFSLSKNIYINSVMIVGGLVLGLISILKLSKNRIIKRIMSHTWWFLIAGIIFGFSGVRYIVLKDSVGGIINLSAAMLFFIIFICRAIK